jgi:hypothetical protein
VEFTPLPFLAGDPNAAAVGFDEVFDDVEAKAGAAGLDRQRVEDAAEFGEQPVDLALADADAVVGDGGNELVALDFEVDLDLRCRAWNI